MIALALTLLLAQPAAPPARVEDGIRLVDQGDFEGAVVALRAAVAAIAGDPTRSVERARGHLYLGIAHLALEQRAEAHRAFVSALRDDPALRITAERFPPKVVTAFEAARLEQPGATRAAGGGSGRTIIAAIAGAAVAGGAAIALTGSASEGLRIDNARFATPAILCPDDATNLPIAYTVLADVANDGEAATIASASITAIITASSAPEVGFSETRPTMAIPSSLPAQRTTTVRLESTLLCSNGPGGPARSNEWTARLILTTSAGTASAETSNRLVVSIP